MTEKPAAYVAGRTYPEIYSGCPSFLGLPVVRNANELSPFDIAVMGAPWEGVVTWNGFSGCELATKSIRNASVRYGGYMPELGFDIFDHLTGCDYGDAPTYPGNTDKTLSMIYEKALEIVNAGTIPITFGGDHSITVPVLQALCDGRKGKVGVIHLDSHLDNMDVYGEHRYARCSPLHRIYELPGVDPKNVVHMAIRGPRSNPVQAKTAAEVGATMITSFDIKLGGVEAAVQKALDIVHDGTDAVYVTVCSDALDVAFNPGGPPDLCGLSSFELARILLGISEAGLDGFDFVEIYPPSDPNHVSSHAAVWMALYAIGGLVKYRFPFLATKNTKDTKRV